MKRMHLTLRSHFFRIRKEVPTVFTLIENNPPDQTPIPTHQQAPGSLSLLLVSRSWIICLTILSTPWPPLWDRWEFNHGANNWNADFLQHHPLPKCLQDWQRDRRSREYWKYWEYLRDFFYANGYELYARKGAGENELVPLCANQPPQPDDYGVYGSRQ